MKKLSQKAVNEIMKRLDYLEARWQDEKKYEDWNDYVAAGRKLVEEKGLKLVKMLKRPFTLECEDRDESYAYWFKVTAKGLSAEVREIL